MEAKWGLGEVAAELANEHGVLPALICCLKESVSPHLMAGPVLYQSNSESITSAKQGQ